MANKTTYEAFMGTVDAVNAAISEHSDKPLIGGVLDAAKKHLDGERLGVAVYKDNPDEPFDYFTVQFNKGKLELKARGKDAPSIDWKVSENYLNAVSDDPESYVANPAKLDFDWIKTRAGMTL